MKYHGSENWIYIDHSRTTLSVGILRNSCRYVGYPVGNFNLSKDSINEKILHF